MKHLKNFNKINEEYDHDKVNDIKNEIYEEMNMEMNFGGDLNHIHKQLELKKQLEKFKKATEKYKVEDSSIPAAGFSGANSATMRSHQSGSPVSYSYNDIHRGGYWGGSTPYVLQIQVGGGLNYETQKAILEISKELIENYTFNTNLGNSFIFDTDGTNWSSVAIGAPRKDNQYSILNSLKENLSKKK